MPNWKPNWENVKWNHAAASRAIAELRREAAALDQSATDRKGLAGKATTEWRGIYRTVFDVYLTTVLKDAGQLARDYREAAKRIADASERARTEQAHRERERERWRREKADEERKEREEREDRAREARTKAV